MYKQIIVLIACLAMALAYPYQDIVDVVEDHTGQQYYLVPLPLEEPTLSRQRRQTSGGVSNTGFDVSHTGTLLNNNNHRLDGTATIAKQFGGPISKGGSLDYTHKPSASSASVYATNTPGWGTDAGARANYNFFQSRDGRTTGSLSGQYDRHFGGPIGTQRPNYGAFVNLNHRF